jgi:hypothetical protein
MSNSCPVLTPAERQMTEIMERADATLMDKVFAALDEVTKQVAADWKTVETSDNPPPYDYFAAVVHQRMFLSLCGADAATMTGGDAGLAGHLIRNQQNVVAHYGWAEKSKADNAG